MASIKLEDSKIWLDCKKILDNESPNFFYKYQITLHTVDEDLAIELFDTIIFQSDYIANLSDYVYLTLNMGIGMYLERVHAYRDNMEVTVSKSKVIDETDNTQVDKQIIRYKAIMLNSDRLYDGTYLDNISADQADKEGYVTLDFQLLDKVTEIMKTIEIGGIYKNRTNTEIILAVLDSEFDKISIDGKKGLDTINVIDGDNKKRIAHTIVPNGIRVLDLPGFLQVENSGVYSGDIGTYVTRFDGKNTCFVYPLYNTNRYETAVKKLTLFSIPTTRYKLVEKNWLVNAGNLNILLGDEEVTLSEGESRYMDEGVGFRMTDGTAMMRKPIVMTKDGPVTDRNSLNYEVANKNRKDGVDYTPSRPGSSNPYVHYSEITERSGMLVSFNWFHSEPDLLYPGMPIEYRFLKNGQLTKLQGSLVGKTSATNKEGIVTTKVSMFILRYDYDSAE